ncbi:glutamic acid-rich protein-like isoform X1 [Olea europaea var. sylvestris]|uniref:glutamic acid-rich protein-like isoform X1 n=1 Tax=Olea europaea var. sylvestris TaxID=158386 RepID=UPI000C1D0650|nr:glutamic acid-rich protein-like isoform X1 [Olea europaea var. sylvestris]
MSHKKSSPSQHEDPSSDFDGHLFEKSLHVDAAPVEEVKSQAEPETNVSSNVKEPEVHELDESTKTVDPYVEEHKETLEIDSADEEEEKEMGSLVNKEEEFSPFTSVEPPAWPAEFDEEEEEDEEEDEYIYKV